MVFLRIKNRRGRKYLYVVPTYRDKERVRHKTKYLCREQDLLHNMEQCSNILNSIEKEITLHSVKDYGDATALFSITQELNLIRILNKHTFKGGGIDAGRLATISILQKQFKKKEKTESSIHTSRRAFHALAYGNIPDTKAQVY